MNKEEFEQLKSTVKQWLFHTGSLDPTDYANELKVKFIEPREKRIEELEEKLEKETAHRIRNFNKAIEWKEKHRALKKENAELKEQNRSYGQLIEAGSVTLMKDRLKNYKQLTKAKEIIKRFSEFANNDIEYDPEHPQEHTDLWNKLCEEAEQFLKELEK